MLWELKDVRFKRVRSRREQVRTSEGDACVRMREASVFQVQIQIVEDDAVVPILLSDILVLLPFISVHLRFWLVVLLLVVLWLVVLWLVVL